MLLRGSKSVVGSICTLVLTPPVVWLRLPRNSLVLHGILNDLQAPRFAREEWVRKNLVGNSLENCMAIFWENSLGLGFLRRLDALGLLLVTWFPLIGGSVLGDTLLGKETGGSPFTLKTSSVLAPKPFQK